MCGQAPPKKEEYTPFGGCLRVQRRNMYRERDTCYLTET